MREQEKTPHERLVARVKALNVIYRGTLVQHFRNKKRYKIIGLSILCDSTNPENNEEVVVNYRDSDGAEYTRKMLEFFGEVINDEGKRVRRFTIQREIMW